MIRILAAALWLAGLAVIASAGAWLVRRAPRAGPAVPAAHPAGAALAGRHGAAAGASDRDLRRIAMNFARFCLFVIAGAVLVYGVMAAVGVLVVHAGPAMDKPVFSWTLMHRMSSWARVMSRLTKIGNTWTTWGACLAAAVCLAVTWRRNRWLPPGRIRRGDRHGPLPDPRAPAHLPPHRTAGKPRRYLPVRRRRSLHPVLRAHCLPAMARVQRASPDGDLGGHGRRRTRLQRGLQPVVPGPALDYRRPERGSLRQLAAPGGHRLGAPRAGASHRAGWPGGASDDRTDDRGGSGREPAA